MNKLSTSVLALFGRAFTGNDTDFKELIKLAMQSGYLVHPDCSTKEVRDFLLSQKMNVNTTFYKAWKDITSKNRFELAIDQILHYMTTYGTNHQSNYVYIPNSEPIDINYTSYKMILPITIEEANERACQMLYSGIALKEDTLNMVLSLVTKIDVDKIANREALMYVCKAKSLLPSSNIEFVRFLVFLATEKTLLIKNRITLQTIINSKFDITSYLLRYGIDNMAQSYYRYEKIFTAFKKGNSVNSTIVNRLSRRAKKLHKPMVVGYFEKLLTDVNLIKELPEKLKTCNIFKKVQLLETINVRKALSESSYDFRFFKIRNGKLWAKGESNKYKDYYSVMYHLIYQSLIEDMSKKATTVKMPKDVNLTIPISEKSFIGNYPVGSSCNLGENHTIVGINWTTPDGKGGHADLDLSIVDVNGEVYSWNNAFTNDDNSIIYSGDMTQCNPEATELFKVRKTKALKGGTLTVTWFDGEVDKFNLFFCSKDNLDNVYTSGRNPMINPDDMKFRATCNMEGISKSAKNSKPKQLLGVFTDTHFVLNNFETGNTRVNGADMFVNFIKYVHTTLPCYLNMEKVLTDAGFTIVNDEKAEIDLTDLSKDTLIKLFS